MGDPEFDQLLRFEGRLERSHVNASMHFNKCDVVERLSTLPRQRALLQMREPGTHELVLVPDVIRSLLIAICPPHLLVNGWATRLVG